MAATGITETVSEKKRRGRPAAFEPKDDRIFHAIYGADLGTRRTLRSKQYLVAGIRAIKRDGRIDERYRWFAGEGKSHRQAILVELGRIAVQFGDANAVVFADTLAELVGSVDNSRSRGRPAPSAPITIRKMLRGQR